MLKKVIYWIIVTIILGICCFNLKSCSESNDLRNEILVSYVVKGYDQDPPAYKRSAHRYVFLHNDKYGDFTFDVTPRTYFDITNGQKNVTFKSSFNELIFKADNDITRKKLYENVEKDFGVSRSVAENTSVIEIFCMITFSIFLIISGCYISFWGEENNLLYFVTSIACLLSVVTSIILCFFI